MPCNSAVKTEAESGSLPLQLKSGKCTPNPTPAWDLEPSVKTGTASLYSDLCSKKVDRILI